MLVTCTAIVNTEYK